MQSARRHNRRTRMLCHRAFAPCLLLLAGSQAGCRDAQLPTGATDLPTTGATAFDVARSRTGHIVSRGHVASALPANVFNFRADLVVDRDGPASGTVEFLFGVGSVRTLRAVASRVDGAGDAGGGWSVLLLPQLPSGELDPSNPAIAVAREPATGGGGGILWDIQGSTVHGGHVQFVVPGRIQPVPASALEPRAPPWFGFSNMRQRVTLLETGEPAGFAARGMVLRDHTADGLIELDLLLSNGLLHLRPVYGSTGDRGRGAGPSSSQGFVLLLVVADAPLVLDNVVLATVRPDANLPGCDIWDFQSNGVHTARFDARGRVFAF